MRSFAVAAALLAAVIAPVAAILVEPGIVAPPAASFSVTPVAQGLRSGLVARPQGHCRSKPPVALCSAWTSARPISDAPPCTFVRLRQVMDGPGYSSKSTNFVQYCSSFIHKLVYQCIIQHIL